MPKGPRAEGAAAEAFTVTDDWPARLAITDEELRLLNGQLFELLAAIVENEAA